MNEVEYATKWSAKGLVERAWKRLDPPTRDELAGLLKVKPNNLSKMNSGKMPMSLDYAKRIVKVVPGLTVADLGAPLAVVTEESPLVLARLESLATDLAKSARKQATMATELRQLRARVQHLEARPWPVEDPTTGQAESL